MTTVYDVPPTPLIAAIAAELQKLDAIAAPEWAAFAKTGIHREKPPVESDWWATRVAAVLRKVYTEGPIGTEKLRQHFGGYRDRGSKSNKAAKGSGSIARKALQQLEAAGLVSNVPAQGRTVTAAGRAMCDNAAHTVRGGLAIEGLEKYTGELGTTWRRTGNGSCRNSRNAKLPPRILQPNRLLRNRPLPNRQLSNVSSNRSWTTRRGLASPASA